MREKLGDKIPEYGCVSFGGAELQYGAMGPYCNPGHVCSVGSRLPRVDASLAADSQIGSKLTRA